MHAALTARCVMRGAQLHLSVQPIRTGNPFPEQELAMTFQHIRMILGFFVGYTTLRFGIPIFFTWLIGRPRFRECSPLQVSNC